MGYKTKLVLVLALATAFLYANQEDYEDTPFVSQWLSFIASLIVISYVIIFTLIALVREILYLLFLFMLIGYFIRMYRNRSSSDRNEQSSSPSPPSSRYGGTSTAAARGGIGASGGSGGSGGCCGTNIHGGPKFLEPSQWPEIRKRARQSRSKTRSGLHIRPERRGRGYRDADQSISWFVNDRLYANVNDVIAVRILRDRDATDYGETVDQKNTNDCHERGECLVNGDIVTGVTPVYRVVLRSDNRFCVTEFEDTNVWCADNGMVDSDDVPLSVVMIRNGQLTQYENKENGSLLWTAGPPTTDQNVWSELWLANNGALLLVRRRKDNQSMDVVWSSSDNAGGHATGLLEPVFTAFRGLYGGNR